MLIKLARSGLVFALLFHHALGCTAEVITHPATPVAEINRQQLRAIFSLQVTQWPDGSPIVVLRLDRDNQAHIAFCKTLLKVLPQQLEAAWERLVFTGQGQRPVLVENEQEMLLKIASIPGAIGYVEQYQDDIEVKSLPMSP